MKVVHIITFLLLAPINGEITIELSSHFKKIDISSIKDGKSFDFKSGNSNITGACGSTVPVIWTFTYLINIGFTRRSTYSRFKEDEFIFEFVKTGNIFWAIFSRMDLLGDYLIQADCSEIGNYTNFHRIYIFASKEPKHRPIIFLKYPDKKSQHEFYGNLVPCLSINPILEVKLQKRRDKEENYVEVQDTVYNPLEGIRFKNNSVFPLGYYSCSNGQEESLDWEVEENSSKLKWRPYNSQVDSFLDSIMQFSCSKLYEKVSFSYFGHWNSGEGNVKVVEEISKNNGTFKKLSITISKNNFSLDTNLPKLVIVCNSTLNESFKWTVSIIEKPKIVKLPELDSFACQLETNQSKQMVTGKKFLSRKFAPTQTANIFFGFYTPCTSVSHCKLIQTEKSLLNPYEMTLKEYKYCENGEETCIKVDLNAKTGIFNCYFRKNIVSQEFFSSLSGTKKVLDWRLLNDNDLVQLHYPTQLYYHGNSTKNIFEVKCEAVNFLFIHYMDILVRLVDNSTFILKSYDYITKTNSIELISTASLTKKFKSIICKVPWRNSTENYIIEKPIDIRDPVQPLFKETNLNVTFIINSTGNYLQCRVYGPPYPESNFSWIINKKLQNESLFKVIQGSDQYESIFEFPPIDKSLEGKYICQAFNDFGTVSQEYEVKVENELFKIPVLYMVLIMASIIIIIISTGALIYWKLIKQLLKLPELTQKEVEELLAVLSNSQMEINFNDFDLTNSISLGEGYSGKVFTGIFGGNEVAIKTNKENSDNHHLSMIMKEINIMRDLGSHENIIQFIGDCTENIQKRVVYIIVELCPFGDLRKFLIDNSETFQDYYKININERNPDVMNTYDQLNWSCQIANGMAYLEQKKVVHSDLAARNVLLYDRYTVKITDFGLSRQLIFYNPYKKTSNDPMPWAWVALEGHFYKEFSSKSDVWSYGVTLWEIFSLGRVPYGDQKFNRKFRKKLRAGKRLEIPEHSNQFIFDKMSKCWLENPYERPSFVELKEFFELLREQPIENTLT